MTDLELDQYDSAKEARNHKNWLLVKALWFWLTMIMFFGICVLIWLAGEPIKELLIVIILSGFMSLFYLSIALFQTMLWWDDDMDGMLPREGGWRF